MHPIVFLLLVFIAGKILWRTFITRWFTRGFKYAYVNNDGSVRELSKSEQDYLLEDFHPNDGARPYIKSNYWEKTPDNKLHDFIKKSRVPWWIKIQVNERPNR